MAFKADAVGKCLTIPVKRYIFNLVVVYDIGLSSCILIRIELLLTACTCALDHSCIDDFEFAVSLLTPLDKESSVVQLRLGRPCNHHCASDLITGRNGSVKVQQAMHRQHGIQVCRHRSVSHSSCSHGYASLVRNSYRLPISKNPSACRLLARQHR